MQVVSAPQLDEGAVVARLEKLRLVRDLRVLDPVGIGRLVATVGLQIVNLDRLSRHVVAGDRQVVLLPPEFERCRIGGAPSGTGSGCVALKDASAGGSAST